MARTDGFYPAGSDLDSTEEQEQSRTYITIGTILLIILVIVVLLLFWRTCMSTGQGGDSGGGGGVITDVPGMQTLENGIAIWVKPGTSVSEVLARNGLEGVEAVDMGANTYVLSVSDDPKAVVERLKNDPGLEDAGFLFAEEK
ncbi:MAG: hypothetical protein U1E29_00575 [Coriobacteriia bacterium]|nr:hypothetical protein [Coriobacteriia bacterium]